MTPEKYGSVPENDYSLEREKYLADLEKLAIEFSKKPHNWQGYGEHDTTIFLSAIKEAKNKNITIQELKTLLMPYVQGALINIAKDENFNLAQPQDIFSIFDELEIDKNIINSDSFIGLENQEAERNLLRIGIDKIATSYIKDNLFHSQHISGYDPETQAPEKAKEILEQNFAVFKNWLDKFGAGLIKEPIQFQRNYGELDKNDNPREPRYKVYEPKFAQIIQDQMTADLEFVVDNDNPTPYLYNDKSERKTQNALQYVLGPRLEMARSLGMELSDVKMEKDPPVIDNANLLYVFEGVRKGESTALNHNKEKLIKYIRHFITLSLFVEKYDIDESFLKFRIFTDSQPYTANLDTLFRAASLFDDVLKELHRATKDFGVIDDEKFRKKSRKAVEDFLHNQQYHITLPEISYDLIPKNLFTPKALFDCTKDILQSAIKDDSELSVISDFLQRYDIPKNWLKEIVLNYINEQDLLTNGRFEKFDKLTQEFEFVESKKKEIAFSAIIGNMSGYNFGSFDYNAIKETIKHFNLPQLLTEYPLPHPLNQVCQRLGLSTIEEFCDLKLENAYFDEYVVYATGSGVKLESISLQESDFKILDKLPFSWVQADVIKTNSINLEDIKTEKDYEKVFELLKRLDFWGDEEIIEKQFKNGAEIFGYKNMFEYLHRERLSPHDGLHAFESIINLYKTSGLKPNQFYGNILKQVSMDDREYEAGTAHHHFNELAQTLSTDFASVLQAAREYRDITLLNELAETFSVPKKIFESWGNLKRYADLTHILEQKEMMENLKELKNTGKEALYSYVEKLAFHPSSKVDMQAVMRFWQEPEKFLDAEATHTPEEVHNRKKPSNYIEIPYLDLTAEELRDALVEGDMDNLQVFTPMEIRYKVGVKGKENIFIAKINRKSDPDGVLAGNDTACCMPFGEGKNNVYTFNPNDVLLTLQIQRPEGTARTIAQSVLTKDKDIKILIPKIIEQLNQIGEHLTKILPEDILKKSPSYLACDNVEVAANYQQNEYPRLIEMIYRDFFKEYMERFGRMQGLNTGKIPIGQGYSDTLTHLPEELNTFAPLAPVGYSDKLGEKVFMLDLTMKIPVTEKTIFVSPIVKQDEQRPFPYRQGLSALTFEDTLPVAYLEGKAYADNESLMVYLHNLENGLIAKDINNAAKHRPNMSLKYLDADGKMRGYILAYEGELSQKESYNEEEDEPVVKEAKEKIIYISDLASDRENKTAGGRLIQGFAQLYKTHYLEKKNLVPIYAQARETTSYRIIQRQLEKIGRDLGIKIKLEELPTYEKGQDTMHPVMIRPVAG